MNAIFKPIKKLKQLNKSRNFLAFANEYSIDVHNKGDLSYDVVVIGGGHAGNFS